MNHLLTDITGAFRKGHPLEILTHPNPMLHRVSTDVEFGADAQLEDLVRDLKSAMRAYDGVGMAAPQAGVLKRVLIYDVSEHQEEPRVLVNPRITAYSTECATADEGCLSFPNIYFPVTRPAMISVEGFDEGGCPVKLEEIDGLLARVIQHECDHLDGIMIIDRAKPHIKKQALRAYATFDTQREEFITIVDDEARDEERS